MARSIVDRSRPPVHSDEESPEKYNSSRNIPKKSYSYDDEPSDEEYELEDEVEDPLEVDSDADSVDLNVSKSKSKSKSKLKFTNITSQNKSNNNKHSTSKSKKRAAEYELDALVRKSSRTRGRGRKSYREYDETDLYFSEEDDDDTMNEPSIDENELGEEVEEVEDYGIGAEFSDQDLSVVLDSDVGVGNDYGSDEYGDEYGDDNSFYDIDGTKKSSGKTAKDLEKEIKRTESNRKRKLQQDNKFEEERNNTIKKLLEKQATKRGKDDDDGDGDDEIGTSLEKEGSTKKFVKKGYSLDPPEGLSDEQLKSFYDGKLMYRYISNKNGSTISFTNEIVTKYSSDGKSYSDVLST